MHHRPRWALILTLAGFGLGLLQPVDAGAARRATHAHVPAAVLPAVTAVTPNSGPAGGGVAVTITGSNFTGATSVHFGTEPVAPVVNSDTSISVTSPALTTPGPVDVTVITPNGTSAVSPGDTFVYGDTYTQVSTNQYSLANSDGSTWQDVDSGGGLTLTISPSVNATAIVSGNADLWTANAGFNQDIGIAVNGTVVAWKESGGFAGTFSPNAAFVQALVPMTVGTTYTVKLKWKANKAAGGTTIYAGAGPIGGHFSPTRLAAQLVPSGGGNLASAVSTQQYQLPNSDGTTWTDMDATNLSLTYTPAVTGVAILTGNVDLWTANPGYNQDVGVSVNNSVVGWKESGGFAGTFSPNAALVQAVVPLTAATSYTVKLQWKTNRPAAGATIFAGAGPIASQFSPTRLTLLFQPSGVGLTDMVSTQQYQLANSDGSSWMDLDATNLKATITPSADCLGVLSGNADLWTASPGYNQDLGIAVNASIVAWKESGGFAGTFSPNAAFVQTVFPMSAATTYTVELQWKTNKPASGATIYAAAGPPGGPFSPTRLTVSLVACARVPGRPGNVRAIGGNAQATINWSAPADHGSPITAYTVTATPAAGTPVTVGGSVTSVTMTGLVNGTIYSFAVTATNSSGTGPPATSNQVAVGAPGAPTGVRAIPGNAQATVSWTPPVDNGSPITGYTVTTIPAVNPVTVGSSTTSTTVTGLTNGTSYTFQVTAMNANGTGLAGSSSLVKIGVPDTPTNVRAAAGNAQATVSWTPPADNGSPITTYTITPSPLTGTPVTVTAPATTGTVTGLTNGTKYTFQVTANNANGTGAAGMSSAIIVGAPGPPTAIRITSGNAQATVSWTPPADNGSPIISYTITPSPLAGTPVTVTAPATTGTVTGLTNGTKYTFQVTATNANGIGQPGSSISVFAGAPGVPTSIRVTGGNAQATVSWTPPADNGSPIISYAITPSPLAGTPVTVTAPATTGTVTGLTNGTKYTFQVTATNANGTGQAGTSNSVIAGAPDAPTSVHAIAGTGLANITWNAPPDNGSTISVYTVTATPPLPSPGYVTVTAPTTTVTITGLTSGTSYRFHVTATNANGVGPPGNSNAVTPG